MEYRPLSSTQLEQIEHLASSSNHNKSDSAARSHSDASRKDPAEIDGRGISAGSGHLCAVMETEGIASEKNASRWIEREHGVRPVEVGCRNKLNLVSLAQIDYIATSNHLMLKLPIRQSFQKLNADLNRVKSYLML